MCPLYSGQQKKAMYKAITLNGDTVIYINDQLLFRCLTIKGIFKDKFYIEDISKIKLLELEIRHFFGFNRRYLIKQQNFSKKIELYKHKQKLHLKVDSNVISINKKIRAWKFEGDFTINNKIYGGFKNSLKIFESSFVFNFEREHDTNLYCIVLFCILVVDEFNTRPPV